MFINHRTAWVRIPTQTLTDSRVDLPTDSVRHMHRLSAPCAMMACPCRPATKMPTTMEGGVPHHLSQGSTHLHEAAHTAGSSGNKRTCGMMDIWLRRCLRPRVATFTPSMLMTPDSASTILHAGQQHPQIFRCKSCH
jgi:hypothetical protein